MKMSDICLRMIGVGGRRSWPLMYAHRVRKRTLKQIVVTPRDLAKNFCESDFLVRGQRCDGGDVALVRQDWAE
jgi:hypothetical protein